MTLALELDSAKLQVPFLGLQVRRDKRTARMRAEGRERNIQINIPNFPVDLAQNPLNPRTNGWAP